MTTTTTPTNNQAVAKDTVKGELTFEEKVIQKIIGTSIGKVDGLLTVDGGFFSNLAGKLVNTNNPTSGISTEVGKTQVAVDLNIVVEFGKDIRDIYEKIKSIIVKEVEQSTHLEVVEVNVNVVDIQTKAEYEENSETVQDKLSSAASTTGDYISEQSAKAKDSFEKGTTKAKQSIQSGTEKVQDAATTESRVK